jgi:rubredoxin
VPKKLDYHEVKANIEQQGYTLLSKRYKNVRSKLSVQCDKGHQYRTTWNNFQQGYRCPHCAGNRKLTHERVKKFVADQGHRLLSKEYKNGYTKLDISCPKGHQYQSTWKNFYSRSTRCPICANVKRSVATRLEHNLVQQYIEQQGYILLSEYFNAHTNLNLQCNRKHQYQATWANFKQGSRCPVCNESKGEREIAQILTDVGLSFIRQYVLPKTKFKIDFYIPSLALGIEYDGVGHFQPIRFGGVSLKRAKENLKRQRDRDQEKEKICKRLGINLFRIFYTESIRQRIKDLQKIRDQFVSDL